MTDGDDISFSALGRIVQQWAGDPAQLTEVIPLIGGSVNNTLLLVTGDRRKVVLKITPHRINRDLETESWQLNYLRDLGIPVPQVYASHTASLEDPNSFLLMEYIEGITLAEAKKTLSKSDYDDLQQDLSHWVLVLHAQTRDSYGKLDATGNHQVESWPTFFHTLHDHVVAVIEQTQEIPIKLRKKIEKLHQRLGDFLTHDDSPRLCHGDLWGANVMCGQDQSGQWKVRALLDPNLRYGHAECELAYMDLFDTTSKTFKRAYQQKRKMDEDYHKIRKPIYQLYPLLNHVQFFGHRYVAPMIEVAERATAVV